MTIKQMATVLVDGKLEIQNPDLHEGDVVDITVTVHQQCNEDKTLSSMIGQATGCYQDAKEVVDFIRLERNQWD